MLSSGRVRHQVYVRFNRGVASGCLPVALIRRCVRCALCFEGVSIPCEVSVLVTDDCGIHELNLRHRGIDRPTDVLSFPLQEFSPPNSAALRFDGLDLFAGVLPLGDIVLSAERVAKQASENARTLEFETALLAVHSVLHLLGYDHIGDEKKLMRDHEKKIIRKMGFSV